MSFQPFLVGDYRAGLQQNVEPWKLLGDALQTAENVSLRNGVLSRRLGYQRLGTFTQLVSSVYAITKASPGVVTTDGDHGLSDGDEVIFRSVGGMTELNGNRYTVNVTAATTFQLDGVDTSSYTTFTSGGYVKKVSKSPIMGLMLHRDTSDDEDLIVADTVYMGKWDGTNERFDHLEVNVATVSSITAADPPQVTTAAAHGLSTGDQVRMVTSAGMTEINDKVYTITKVDATNFTLDGETASTKTYTGGATTGTVRLLNINSGDNTQYFDWVNWGGSIYMVNGNDRMLAYDGTTLSRPVIDFTNATPTTNELTTARHIFVSKDRLCVLWTNESGTTHKQRLRFSTPGVSNATVWHDQDNGGTGGYIDAPTGDPIVSKGMLDDDIIVFTRRKAWKIRYTGNAILPFRWELINSTRKTEVPHGTVQFDKFVTSVGTTGIIACNGENIERMDQAIPDFAAQMNADLFANFYAYRFEENESLYFTYADSSEEKVNHALVYHFEDKGWTVHNYKLQHTITGITAANPPVVTTYETPTFNDGDKVLIESVSGMTEVNNNTYVVDNIDTDAKTFELQGVTGSGFTTYTSGGTVTSGHAVSVLGEWGRVADDATWANSDEEWNELSRVWNDARFQIGASLPLMGDAKGEIWELDVAGADRAYDSGSDITGLPFTSTIKTKRLNPYLDQGLNAELGYIDILFSKDDTAQVGVELFLNSESVPYIQGSLSKETIDLTAEYAGQTRIWKRIYANATGSSHELQLSVSGQDMYMDIHAMIFWFRPAGRLELHA